MDVTIPADMWGDEGDAVIATWLFQGGELVSTGAVLAEVMYEKASMEVTSPGTGRLTIRVEAESPVRQGQLVGKLEAGPTESEG